MFKLTRLTKTCLLNSLSRSPFTSANQTLIYEKFKDFNNTALNSLQIPGVTIANTKEKAKKALEVLYKVKDRAHGWDTETIDIEAKEESPVGKGRIICATAFCGPEVDFGDGPRLFIDNFGTNHDNILIFKDYFENQEYKKVWHNYGYDRHILYNHGINAKYRGFFADTMHMARLYDSSFGPKGYSLANLTVSFEKKILETKNKIVDFLDKVISRDDPRHRTLNLYKRNFMATNYKKSMYKLFGRPKVLKSGKPGKTVEIPPIVDLHTREDTVESWVTYACLDAEITFFLRETLFILLKELKTDFEGMRDMNDVYEKYWRPFGEMLTDMERVGIKVNRDHLKEIQGIAEKDLKVYSDKFMNLVRLTQKDAEEFNPSSPLQLQQLLFAPFKRIKKEAKSEDSEIKELNGVETFVSENGSGEAEVYGEDEPKRKVIRKEVDEFPLEKAFPVENKKGVIIEGKKAPLKHRDMIIKGLGIPPGELTETGLPSVDTSSLKILAGDVKKQKYGTAYQFLKKNGQEELGIKVCESLGALIEFKAIETLLQTFILPLQVLPDENDRVHTSINIFTETGRLASRRPNLQNQPALEKDKYKIRLSFQPEKGNKFIVADYGQLELRLLAHITDCKSMLEAFKSGGDFHSRTAIGMYPNIKKEVESGEVLLEWDSSKGPAPKPLVKDKYASERKKAKGMNFSIAYGKSAHGFAKDWGCSIEEAQQALDAWYNDRIEVKKWQDKTKGIALEKGWTQTLIGRYRNLTHLLKNKKRGMVSHALRAAINTPIQGGAADLVIAAMVKLHQNQQLRKMGWKCLLQIHDEEFLIRQEGPEENANEALKLTHEIMEHPFDFELRVPLEISADICDNWYEAK